MAIPNIAIPPLIEGQRIDDWQPLFIAATSTLVATAGEKAAIQILPSLVCRDAFERATALESVKEETLEAAFKILHSSLDAPIDEYEATSRFRELTWARGTRVEVFFTQLWTEAKRASLPNRHVCVVLTTQIPDEAQGAAKGWISAHSENLVSDKETREFLKLIQTTLRQKGIALDHGFRIPVTDGKRCAVVNESQVENSERDIPELCDSEVHRVYTREQGKSSRRREDRPRYTEMICFTCGRRGHGYRACPERICDICRKQGHDAGQCVRSKPNVDRYRGKNKVMVVDNDDKWDERSATVTVQVDGKTVRALLDTGARVNVMDRKALGSLGLDDKLIQAQTQVYGVCSTPVQVVGYVNVSIKIPGERAHTEKILVLEGEEQALLLGRRFMERFGRVVFDWNEGVIEIGKARAAIHEIATGGRPLDRARSIRFVTDDSPMLIKEVMDTIGKGGIAGAERRRVNDLLEEYAAVFSEMPGRTDRCEHAVDTGNAVPSKNRPRRLPPRWEEEINQQLDELLDHKLCRPSSSPWASNVVLVTKKDGRKRFAIDYRSLNSVTKKDAYGIPQIQSILDRLKGYRYFSVLDIASAYWCVPVRECDIEKTAFNTPRGLYEMTVMPFGLVNAQATFQRLMDNILQGTRNAESYVDDCIVYSQNFDSHLEDLREVLERLRDAKLHVKLRKCQFVREEVEFLGHLVSGRGKRPLPTAAVKLEKFPKPQSVAELQRFLGSLNFYRSYIPGMAQTASPLYELTKKSSRWKWTESCESAFNDLRKALVVHPLLLAHPDWEKEFVIEADASATAVAAILSQRDDHTGELRPIDYFSSALNPAQRNYAAGQLEAWALVAACRKWAMYLRTLGSVELVTDHNPLKWLREQKDPRHTFARWVLELEEFDYRITYRPGKQNVVPDYLSRVPGLTIDEAVQDDTIFENKIFIAESAEELVLDFSRLQRGDLVIRRALLQLGRDGTVATGQLKRVADHLVEKNGLLFFDKRIVVPMEARHQVLSKVHAAGHFGLRRTLQLLRRSYFWSKMTRDAKEFCNSCLPCQRAKASNRPREPLEEFITTDIGPGDLIAMDVATLPWADEGYRYFLCIVDVFTRYLELVPHQGSESSVIS